MRRGTLVPLGLYDPDRSRQVVLRSGGQDFAKSWDDVAADLAGRLTGTGDVDR